jgi:hypothetical protein
MDAYLHAWLVGDPSSGARVPVQHLHGSRREAEAMTPALLQHPRRSRLTASATGAGQAPDGGGGDAPHGRGGESREVRRLPLPLFRRPLPSF